MKKSFFLLKKKTAIRRMILLNQTVIIVLLCFIAEDLIAQNLSFLEQRDASFDGKGYDELTSIKMALYGGYILDGSSLSGNNGDKTEPVRGGTDYWIVQTGALGKKHWDKRLGDDSIDTLITHDGDKDGLTDNEEYALGTDPENFDTNGDGLADGVNVMLDLDPLGTDTDNDEILNTLETENGTSPVLKDTDGDGVADNIDPFPLDRYRTKLPPPKPSDHQPPVIILMEPPL